MTRPATIVRQDVCATCGRAVRLYTAAQVCGMCYKRSRRADIRIAAKLPPLTPEERLSERVLPMPDPVPRCTSGLYDCTRPVAVTGPYAGLCARCAAILRPPPLVLEEWAHVR